MTAPERGKAPASNTARAKAHLAKLRKQGGQRILVDLDAEAHAALLDLKGRGVTTKAAVCKALVELASRSNDQ